MQIPDPSSLAKGMEKRDDIARRARELARSALLKVWEPEEHPRTGMPPNPGWFGPLDGSQEQNIRVAVRPGSNNPWNEFPDAEGGGGGEPPSRSDSEQAKPAGEELPANEPAPTEAPKAWTQPDPKTKLPFMGETPPQLAPRKEGDPTAGIFWRSDGPPVELHSGYDRPSANMPPGSPGLDGRTMSHVEAQAAALMQQEGLMKGAVETNNSKICERCTRLLPRMLPPGATLKVVLPGGRVEEFKNINR